MARTVRFSFITDRSGGGDTERNDKARALVRLIRDANYCTNLLVARAHCHVIIAPICIVEFQW